MSEHIDQLRQQHPAVSPGFFDLLEERNRIYDELSELRGTIAHLVGWHEGCAERTGNTDLAALVGELRLAIGLSINNEERAR